MLARRSLIGSPIVFEAGMVTSSRMGGDGLRIVRELLARLDAVEIPFNERHASIAHEAFANFGKGRHPAGLNFGDCMAYAVAKVAGQPLLFVDEDFGQTDIAAA